MASKERICICGVQVPFARGGAENLIEALRQALLERGYPVDVVTIPFKWYPSRQVLAHALPWRLLDLSESQGRTIDVVIATKFPSYLVRHPNKVTWLVHQYRQAYDLFGTPYGDLTDSPEDQRIRRLVTHMDNTALPESKRIFTIAKNVSSRLARYNGLEGTPLYPPPPLGDRYFCEAYEDFILVPGRLETIKRIDLLLRALAQGNSGLRCVITGAGPDAQRLMEMAKALDLTDRVRFSGFVPEEELLRLYARCRAVYYAPYDEDYGFVTLEAMRSHKPVITTADAGGVLEFVAEESTGFVTSPDPEAVAQAIDRVAGDQAMCQRLGEAGSALVQEITWERVLDGLLSAAA